MAGQTVKGRFAAHLENGPQVSEGHQGHGPQEGDHPRQSRQSKVHQQAGDAGIKDALIEALLQHAVLVDLVMGVEVIDVRNEAQAAPDPEEVRGDVEGDAAHRSTAGGRVFGIHTGQRIDLDSRQHRQHALCGMGQVTGCLVGDQQSHSQQNRGNDHLGY